MAGDDSSAKIGRATQHFACEVCGEIYEVEADHDIERITVDCRECPEPSAWAFPVDCEAELATDGGQPAEDGRAIEQAGSRGIEFIRDSEDLLAVPMQCWGCGGEVDQKRMILLSEGRPVCRGCSEEADEVVDADLHIGYPNNNVDLDLDESTRWLEIEERLPVEVSVDA
jgi:hypothetical protein